jgi:hypothetical protein
LRRKLGAGLRESRPVRFKYKDRLAQSC